MARPPGIGQLLLHCLNSGIHALAMPSGCAGGFRGFPTAHPCTGGKLARIHAGHPADFPPPTRRTIGAPGEAARSCAQKQSADAPRHIESMCDIRLYEVVRRTTSFRVVCTPACDDDFLEGAMQAFDAPKNSPA